MVQAMRGWALLSTFFWVFAPSVAAETQASNASDLTAAAAPLQQEWQKVSDQLNALLSLDGQMSHGRLTISTLQAMEVDSSAMVRDLTDLFRAEMVLSRNPKLTADEMSRITIHDLFAASWLRRSMALVIKNQITELSQIQTLTTHGAEDFRLRNRIAFFAYYLQKSELLLEQVVRYRQISDQNYQTMKQAITNVRVPLIASIAALETYTTAYLAAGFTAVQDSNWFLNAKNGLGNGRMILGRYVFDKDGLVNGYMLFEGGDSILLEATPAAGEVSSETNATPKLPDTRPNLNPTNTTETPKAPVPDEPMPSTPKSEVVPQRTSEKKSDPGEVPPPPKPMNP